MSVSTDSNQCIQAILDEYYEGSYEGASYESEAFSLTDNKETVSISDRKSENSEQIIYHQARSDKNVQGKYLHTVSPGSSGEYNLISSTEPITEPQNPHISNLAHCEVNRCPSKSAPTKETKKIGDCSSKEYNGSCTIEYPHSFTSDIRCESPRIGVHQQDENATIDYGNIECRKAQKNPEEHSDFNKETDLTKQGNMPVISYEEKQSTKSKKPFLKKGSRKEPSSIQCVRKNIIQNGMRFKNDLKVTGDGSSSEERNLNDLEHLERMQREQIENLEKRIERREKAREEIKQNRLQKQKEIVGIENQMNGKSTKDNTEDEGTKSSVESSDDSNDYQSDDETEEESSNEEEISLSERLNSKRFPRKSNDFSPKLRNKNQRRQLSSCSRIAKRGNVSNKNGIVDLKSPEIVEQWQVIKSMRKRQEAALRAAEKEREEVSNKVVYCVIIHLFPSLIL
jgi:hypothetical protein